MRRVAPFLIIASTVAGCTVAPASVEQYGAIRSALREGQTQARLALTDAIRRPHAIAVGALEDLAGEITIFDGEVWVARPGETGLAVTGPGVVSGDQATLLTRASVDRWREVPIDRRGGDEPFDAMIERLARAQGTDTTRPFPFVVDGVAAQLEIHAINGYCPMLPKPAGIDTEPWRWRSTEPTPATIVGFYAPDAEGVMTHHGTSVHAHALLTLNGRTVTGHVERVEPAAGSRLRLPANPDH